ncbi:hypothetical protein AVEN_127920-1 [Araneus ventricosus]|uniref:Uncharacterized protein n=1 Tax=Araneus ventricosus TaxID=182803 RepID=A0A4Y1ZYT8_ARAVE|nr:hypothetical protein AVEN_127920-1 [Araneus ventricosus]
MGFSHDTSSRVARSSKELGFRVRNPNVVNRSGKDGWRFYACGNEKNPVGPLTRRGSFIRLRENAPSKLLNTTLHPQQLKRSRRSPKRRDCGVDAKE